MTYHYGGYNFTWNDGYYQIMRYPDKLFTTIGDVRQFIDELNKSNA